MDARRRGRDRHAVVTGRATVRSLAAVLLAVTLLLVACSDSTTVTTERPLTNDEATLLADALYLNWQEQGATFVANAAWTSAGRTVTMQGEVDWAGIRGHALVRSTGADEGLAEVWWTSDVVVERWPGLDGILTSLGFAGARFVARPPDPEGRLVDHVIAILAGLASQQRENPILIQQTTGSAFIRDDELRGSPVQVLRYGGRSLFWLSTEDAHMDRFDGNASSGTAPTVIDILTNGPQSITLPPVDQTVPSTAIDELYRQLTGG